MQLVHSQLTVEAPFKKPTKKQLYHQAMAEAKRRREFIDFETALKDPEVMALIKKVQEVSPGWMPKFRG